MSLYFVNSHLNQPTTARSVDDSHIRSSILLAPHQVNPLVDNIRLQYCGPTWRLATTGREELLQGKRFENAVWRLWAQQLLKVEKSEQAEKFRRMMPRGRYWREKELLVPIVVSQETFHNKIELFLVQPTIDVGSLPMMNATLQPCQPTAGTEDALSLRTCLKRLPGSVYGSESPLSLRSSLPSSSPANTSPSSRRVLFNACVERSEIAAAPLQYTHPENEDGSLLGLVFNDDQYQDVYSLGEVLYQFRPRPQQSVFENSSDEEDEFYPLLPTTLLDRSDAVVVPLHPGQIAPLPGSESDHKVTFVAPKGMADLDEHELRPYQSRPLRRRVRILDLSQMVFAEAEEVEEGMELEQLGDSGVNSPDAGGGLKRVASGDTWFTDGWLSDGGRAPLEDEKEEFEEYGKGVDEGKEVDGDMYYDCQEGYDWEDRYGEDEDGDGDDASSDGVELVGMMATSLSSFFW